LEPQEFLLFWCNPHHQFQNIVYKNITIIFSQIYVMVCLMNWIVHGSFVVILTQTCINPLLFSFVQIDFTLNSNLWIHSNFIHELPCFFFMGVKECTLGLHFVIKLIIDELFTCNNVWQTYIMNFASNDLVRDGWIFFILCTCVSNVF
jgi:hypothetical protein